MKEQAVRITNTQQEVFVAVDNNLGAVVGEKGAVKFHPRKRGKNYTGFG